MVWTMTYIYVQSPRSTNLQSDWLILLETQQAFKKAFLQRIPFTSEAGYWNDWEKGQGASERMEESSTTES